MTSAWNKSSHWHFVNDLWFFFCIIGLCDWNALGYNFYTTAIGRLGELGSVQPQIRIFWDVVSDFICSEWRQLMRNLWHRQSGWDEVTRTSTKTPQKWLLRTLHLLPLHGHTRSPHNYIRSARIPNGEGKRLEAGGRFAKTHRKWMLWVHERRVGVMGNPHDGNLFFISVILFS